MADLKPCPFCGGEAVTENRHNRWTDWWEVKCTDCNASLNERYEYEFEAVEAWNTRKPMEAVVAELEALEEERLKLYDWQGQTAVDRAIEIVRNGGKE